MPNSVERISINQSTSSAHSTSSSSNAERFQSASFSLFSSPLLPCISRGSPTSSIAPDHDYQMNDDEVYWNHLQRRTDELVQRLLREKREDEKRLNAYAERRQTLEQELARLAIKVDTLEKDKELNMAAGSNNFNDSGIKRKALPSQILDVRRVQSTSKRAVQIDSSKPMSKQNPPPCNAHYLVGVCSTPRCKFSHEYELTPSQVEDMRRGAKFHPCNALTNGLVCEDASCCYGHSCPRGSACGRSFCKFTAEQHAGVPLARSIQTRRR